MGKMMPPMLEPVDRMPKAVPRFLKNQPGMQLMAVEGRVSYCGRYETREGTNLVGRWPQHQ